MDILQRPKVGTGTKSEVTPSLIGGAVVVFDDIKRKAASSVRLFLYALIARDLGSAIFFERPRVPRP